MRTLVLALALIPASVMYAQTGCSSSSSSTLPETSGCLPATFTPADGGPSRPVLLDVQFTNFQGGSAPTPPAAMKLRELDLGVFGSYSRPDYGNPNGNIDAGVWATFTANHFGVQADAADTVDSRGGIRERSVVVGPRFQVRSHGVTFYAKAQAGGGHFSGDIYNTVSNKTTRVIEQYGGGVEVNPTKHLQIRAVDYSYQVWPEFSPHNLTPMTVSAGLAMRF